jgi:flagellar biosynthesis/type III secretory pathway protein FliH
MTMEERDRQIREDGYLAGIADGEENGRKQGEETGIQLAGDVMKLISQQPDITDTELAERFQCSVEVVQKIRKAFER